jgi:CheY-like chemotaxis protein
MRYAWANATSAGAPDIFYFEVSGYLATTMMNAQILLVDDNAIQAEVRQAILARAGASVLVARDAVAALEMLENDAVRTSLGLMVTDHLMPGMNGPELVARVRALLPDLPILVLSGLPDAEVEYQEDHVLFRLKPFPPNELIRLVRHMLGDRALRSA